MSCVSYSFLLCLRQADGFYSYAKKDIAVAQREIRIGIPCEIMPHEGRVPLLPLSLDRLRKELTDCDLYFDIERGVGASLGLTENIWRTHGARVCEKNEVYDDSDIIFKVKQPFPEEVDLYHSGQLCACFHHAATNQNVITALMQKNVLIAPFEYHRPGLAAMSREAGKQVVTILQHVCGDNWKQRHVFFGGARGIVCQYAIFDCLVAGVLFRNMHACDIASGRFFAPETNILYKTFSSRDDEEMCEHLEKCRIVVLAAVSSRGAPRFLTSRHLDIMPDDTFIIQISIDEGGNIEDPAFQNVTYWGQPTYIVERGHKRFTVCNVPDIPGCLARHSASIALDKANYAYYHQLIASFPNPPRRFLYPRE